MEIEIDNNGRSFGTHYIDVFRATEIRIYVLSVLILIINDDRTQTNVFKFFYV